jgi:hypothetical protein
MDPSGSTGRADRSAATGGVTSAAQRARYRRSGADPRSQRASGYFVVSAGGPRSYLLSCALNTIRARPVAREALEALVQHASEAPSPLIAPNRDEMDVRQCLRRDDEPEQVRRHSAVLVPDHEGTVAELVDEHRMVHRGQVTLAPKSGEAVDDLIEVGLRDGFRLHVSMLARSKPL